MTELKQAYIQTPAPQEQIHARFLGDSGPFIFFMHQWPLSSRQFGRVIPLLADRYRAFGLDAPGYGMSPSTLTQQDFIEYARRVLDAIDALGARQFVLVGAEIGVGIAAEVARLAGPGRATHLLALAVPPVDPDEHRGFVAELGEAKPQQDGSHVVLAWQQLERRLGNHDPFQMQMAYTEKMNIFGRYHWGLRAYAGYDLAAGLRSVHCPTLFLSAERDPMAKHAPAAAALVAGARHQIVPGARQTLAWTEPQTFVETLRRFITND
ncbi:MAG: alpha/beta hydrolase [Alphaproteobacteria bacterium]|nr:alpha/beta hydrolase [Alphaproteobacteria bacterium]